jgi:hypothetical protein
MKRFQLVTLSLASLLLFGGCYSKTPKNTEADQAALQKITFDLNTLNEDGLYGPPNGLRALDYEFCIPAQPQFAEEVKALDASLKIYPSSSGRIGCSREQYLCIGNTHQKNYRTVLLKLASLAYVEKIDQTFWE